MTKLIGETLTEEFSEAIDSRGKDSNEVIFLSSIDHNGFPNTALLSYFEVCVVSRKELLFAIGSSSSTRRNLEAIPKASLAFWLGKDKGMIYVKGTVSILTEILKARSENRRTTAFRLAIGKVTIDQIPGIALLSTVTYDPVANNQERTDLHDELRELARK